MNKALGAGMIVLVLALWAVPVFANGHAETQPLNKPITVTGTLMSRDGISFTIKTDEGKVYSVNAAQATVMLDQLPGNCMSLRVGDKVRVYGMPGPGNTIDASRMRVFLSETEANATVMPPPAGAGPTRPVAPPLVVTAPVTPTSSDDGVRLYTPGQNLGTWWSRGLVTGVQYGLRQLTVATSEGPYVVDVRNATFVRGARTVALAQISEGDSIRIWGDVSGLRKIKAERIELLGTKSAQDASVPVGNKSVVGTIDSIDYPSFTFRINTGAGEVRVLADENSFIHLQGNRKAFMDLSIGQRVKVEGLGNAGSGYVAGQIQIIGDPGP